MSSNKVPSTEKHKKDDKSAVDDTSDANSRKRVSEEVSEIEKNVHSANDWEHADLGDSDRKSKFLKLMGASKKKHDGKLVIGEHNPPHKRRTDAKKLNEELEEQYQHSVEHKLTGFKRHVGLGFVPEEKQKNTESVVDDDVSRDSEILPPETEAEEHQDEETGCKKKVLGFVPAEKQKEDDDNDSKDTKVKNIEKEKNKQAHTKGGR